jgi:hypothetical protein
MTARGTTDEAIDRAANLVRYGDRTKLLNLLAGAAFAGGCWQGRIIAQRRAISRRLNSAPLTSGAGRSSLAEYQRMHIMSIGLVLIIILIIFLLGGFSGRFGGYGYGYGHGGVGVIGVILIVLIVLLLLGQI